jgi:hypothetical protein
VAILPERGLGVALKIEDGATRAAECVVAAILAHLGVLDPRHPAAARRLTPLLPSRRGLPAARIAPAEDSGRRGTKCDEALTTSILEATAGGAYIRKGQRRAGSACSSLGGLRSDP